jgi:hypothetical protein
MPGCVYVDAALMPSAAANVTGDLNFDGALRHTAGLLAQVIEAQAHERPMRRIDPVNHGYDGLSPWTISDAHSS